MATDAEVLAFVRRVVEGGTTLDSFEDWFLTEAVTEDTPLVNRVSGILAETAGDLAVVVTGLLSALLAEMPIFRVVGSGSSAAVQSVDTTGWFGSGAFATFGGANITTPVDCYPVPA